jgi:hypothetical protein
MAALIVLMPRSNSASMTATPNVSGALGRLMLLQIKTRIKGEHQSITKT